MARRNNEISDSIKKDLDEKSKQIQQDNVNLNKLVEDMGNTMNLQQSTIVQLRDTVSDLKNQIKFREEKEMMQPDVRDVTKLEIALEGEKRINLIQSNRCDQLTKRFYFFLIIIIIIIIICLFIIYSIFIYFY